MDANQTSPGYQLKDELARYCLPAANRDPNRRLAWVNSICILFLLIGVFGAQSIFIPIKPVPPQETPIAAIIEPIASPPETAAQEPIPADEQKNDTPQTVSVAMATPEINFAVPTIGNLVVPGNLAKAPPARPMNPVAPLQVIDIASTGDGGDRPKPTYPKIAMQQGQQGTVELQMTVDDTGAITDIGIKDSSGYPILDRSALDFVKRHWIVRPQNGSHRFTTKVIYVLKPR